MSTIQRIKNLMMITEQSYKKVVTPSINIDALITMLLFLKEKNSEMFEDINGFDDVDFTESSYSTSLEPLIVKNLPLFGLPKFDGVIEDLYGNFILENIELIRSGETDKTKYTIPTLKKFEVLGEERYSGRKGDIYKLVVEGYSEEFIKKLIENHEIHISDGEFLHEEWGDTWDSEQIVDEIKEVPMNPSSTKLNEETDLSNYEAKFTSEDFVNYVNSEFDLEMLEIMKGVIDKRMKEINSLLYLANRKEIKGFRK